MIDVQKPKAYRYSGLNLKDFYTPAKEAGEIIRERWQNKKLRETIEAKFGENIPVELLKGPLGVIWRQIGTPDREFERFLELTKEAKMEPRCLETPEDKFVGSNFTKLGLTNLPFMTGLDKSGKTMAQKEKIIDFTEAGGKRLCDINTLWGESLVDFHHWFLRTVFPIMEGKITNIYSWTKVQNATPREFYPRYMAFALAHYIIFDDFDLLAAEDEFTTEVVLPSFREIEKEFNLQPLVVKISKPGEHSIDQYWWCYAKETQNIMAKHKKEFIWT